MLRQCRVDIAVAVLKRLLSCRSFIRKVSVLKQHVAKCSELFHELRQFVTALGEVVARCCLIPMIK